jgi:ribonuclease BN (tRNA processing enzyme)
MKITILGCWAPFPRALEACSGYLVEWGETSVLLDCGHGVFSKFQKFGDLQKLNALIISHLHPDHYADIHCFRYAIAHAIRQGKRAHKLKLFLPFSPQAEFTTMQKSIDAFELHDLSQVSQIKVGNLNIYPFRTEHALPTYGVSVYGGSAKVVYTSDTAWFSKLPEIVKEAALLICEASLQEKDRDNQVGHLTAKQAGDLARKGNVHNLLITHLFPEYNESVTEREAEEGFGAGVLVAKEGLVVKAKIT